jgi:hypothetical protein
MMNKYFTNENIDKIERIINFIKPKFYNKLTWIIVGTGLAIISKPVWIEILNTVLNKNYQLNITDGDDAFIGLSLVVIALIYNLITVYFDKFLTSKQVDLEKEKQKKKDKELFEIFLKELPSGDNINFFNSHDFVNSFDNRITNRLENFVECWNNAEKEFLDNEIEILKKDFLQNTNQFLEDLSNGSYTIERGKFNMQTTIPDAYFGKGYHLPDEITNKIDKLNKLSRKIFNLHQAFIRKCKEKL